LSTGAQIAAVRAVAGETQLVTHELVPEFVCPHRIGQRRAPV